MERNISFPPPRRRSFRNAISALRAKISRTLSSGDEATLTDYSDIRSISTASSTEKESSVDHPHSRGPGSVHQSSGRGGAGNIRQASVLRSGARPSNSPDDFSIVRGREHLRTTTRTFSTGRGGAGNICSFSRRPPTPAHTVQEDNNILNAAIIAARNTPHSSGRGGSGNILCSRSRGPTRLRGRGLWKRMMIRMG